MAEESPSLKRGGTMKVTAQEGTAFLEGAGFQDGNAKTRAQVSSPPKMARQSTMQATAKEAEDFVGSISHGRTRSATRRRSAASASGDSSAEPSPAKKPAMRRAGTMAATAKEGKEFLERQPPAAEPEPAEPAAEADPEPAAEAAPEPEPAKAEEAKPAASLKRDSTMAATAKEGLAFLESHLARQQPSTDNNNSASPPAAAPAANAEPAPELKRDGTMIATAKEAKTILGDAAPTGATRAESAAITSTSAVSEKTAEKRDHDGEDEGSAAKRVKE